MNKKLIIGIAVLVALGLAGVFLYPKVFHQKTERKILYWTDSMIPGDRSDHPGKSPMGMERTPVYAEEAQSESVATGGHEEESYYTCPMHPSVRKDRPGACPVCGMALVKKTVEKNTSSAEKSAHGAVTVSASKQVLANVSTMVVKRMRLQKEIRAVGRIDYAEPNFRHISTRFPGRLEHLYLTYTGQKVRKGDPVADVYSPEAISAQQEFLLSLNSYSTSTDAQGAASSGAAALLEQSREKLVRWGITETQIAELQRSRKVKELVTIYSPITGTVLKKSVDPQHYAAAGEDIYDVADLSTVWVYADVYEYELKGLKGGQVVEATSEAYPGEVFRGKITFISPTIEPSSRTVSVRAQFPNPNEKLKPEMFVNAKIKIDLPISVAVPVTAVLSTGQRQVVWVKKTDGVFEPRLVTLGERAGNYYQILSGIYEGETVVTSGGYLIDSESQLQTATTSGHEGH